MQLIMRKLNVCRVWLPNWKDNNNKIWEEAYNQINTVSPMKAWTLNKQAAAVATYKYAKFSEIKFYQK